MDGRLPLEGILVADFSRVLAGPLAAMWLADLGATVVKVEHTGRGDDTRRWGPPWAASSSSYFAAANRSKVGIELDLSREDDLEVAHRLVARADVVLENFVTGTMERWGLDHEALSLTNPRLITCSITGYGSRGGADLPGYDFLVQAAGGLMSITGEADGEPTKVGVALVDVLTAKDAMIGILAALRSRDVDGYGQHVEVNLLSSLLASLANQASSFLATGDSPVRMGNDHPSIAPYEMLRCRDGMLAIACGNDRQFRSLVTTLSIPAVADDPRFATNAARVRNRADLRTALESALKSEGVGHWERLLTAARVPAGRVGTVEDGFRRATDLGLEPIVDMPHPHPPQVAHPIRYSRSGWRAPTPPPELGVDTPTVLAWLDSNGSAADLEESLRMRPTRDSGAEAG